MFSRLIRLWRCLRSALCVAMLMAAGAATAQTPLPAWLAKKVQGYEALGATAIRTVDATQYRGQSVYWVRAGCCDIPSELYGEGGQLLCYPDGGFAGGDGRCADFIPAQAAKTRLWPAEKSAPGQLRVPTPAR